MLRTRYKVFVFLFLGFFGLSSDSFANKSSDSSEEVPQADDLFDLLLRPMPKYFGAKALFLKAESDPEFAAKLSEVIASDPRLRSAAKSGLASRGIFITELASDFSPLDGTLQLVSNPMAFAIKSFEDFLESRKDDLTMAKLHPNVAEARARGESLRRFGHQNSNSVHQREDHEFQKFFYRLNRWLEDESEPKRDTSQIILDDWRRYILKRIHEARIRNIMSVIRILRKYSKNEMALSGSEDQPLLDLKLEMPADFDPLKEVENEAITQIRPLQSKSLKGSDSWAEGIWEFLNRDLFPSPSFEMPFRALRGLYHRVNVAHPLWIQSRLEEKYKGESTRVTKIPKTTVQAKTPKGDVSITGPLQIDPKIWQAIQRDLPELSVSRKEALGAYLRDAMARDIELERAYEKIRGIKGRKPADYRRQLKNADEDIRTSRYSAHLSLDIDLVLQKDLVNGLRWWGKIRNPEFWAARDNEANQFRRPGIEYKALTTSHLPLITRSVSAATYFQLSQIFKLRPALRPAAFLLSLVGASALLLTSARYGLPAAYSYGLKPAIKWMSPLFKGEGKAVASQEVSQPSVLSDIDNQEPTNDSEGTSKKANPLTLFKVYSNHSEALFPAHFNVRLSDRDIPYGPFEIWTADSNPSEKVLTVANQVPIQFKKGAYSIPVPEGFRLSNIRVFVGKDGTSEPFESYTEYPVGVAGLKNNFKVYQDTQTGLVTLNSHYGASLIDLSAPVRISAEFSSMNDSKFSYSERELASELERSLVALNQNRLRRIAFLLQDAGFELVSLKLQARIESSGSRISISELARLIRDHSIYSGKPEGKTKVGQEHNPFRDLSKFVIKGVAHFECDGSNTLLMEILREYFRGGLQLPQSDKTLDLDKDIRILPLVSYELGPTDSELSTVFQIQSGALHQRTLVALPQFGANLVLDATPTKERRIDQNSIAVAKRELEFIREQNKLLAKTSRDRIESEDNEGTKPDRPLEESRPKRAFEEAIIERRRSLEELIVTETDNEDSGSSKDPSREEMHKLETPSHWAQIARDIDFARKALSRDRTYQALPAKFRSDESNPFGQAFKISLILYRLATGEISIPEAESQLKFYYSNLDFTDDDEFSSLEFGVMSIARDQVGKLNLIQSRIKKGELKDYRFMGDQMVVQELKALWAKLSQLKWRTCAQAISALN